MKSSCISHPEREPLVIIRKSQVEFCDGNQCAAAVLSFLEYWHNWKLDSDQYNKKSNDIAEMHGDLRSLSEDVYQYHTHQEISDGILNLYSTRSISDGIKLLESKRVVSTHRNPNPRYHYDKTTYFRFYPEVYNAWLKARETRTCKNAESTMQKNISDPANLQNASCKKALPSCKNAAPITEINNIDKNQSLNAREDFFDLNENQPPILENTTGTEVKAIVGGLIRKGMPSDRFQYPDVMPIIDHLEANGATLALFLEAYDVASTTTQGKGFGIRYLAKAVEDLLATSKRQKSDYRHSPPSTLPVAVDFDSKFYDEELSNVTWMDDNNDEDK